MNKVIKILLIVMLLTSSAAAKSALDLGIAGVGARPMGMGRSFVAVANDVNALFMNPAGLAFQESWGLTSMSTKLLNRVDYKMIGGIYPTDQGTFGVGYIALTTPAGYLTTDLASLASATPISYGSSMFILSYAYDLNDQIKGDNLGHLAVGGNLKVISNKFEGIDNTSGSGIEADLAVLFKPSEEITLGANFQNSLGGNVKWDSNSEDDIPSVLKLGIAYQVWPDLLLSLDSDYGSSGNLPILAHAGAEWSPRSIITLRAGIDQEVAGTQAVNNLTAGTSINFSGFSFEYAYRHDTAQAELSNHYFSISFAPPAERTKLAAKPKKEKEKTEVEEEKAAPDSAAEIETKRSNNSELSYDELMKKLYGSNN